MEFYKVTIEISLILYCSSMAPLVVAGTNQDLQKYPNQIVLDLIKNNFPNPLTVTIFDQVVNLTPFNPNDFTGDIRFQNNQYQENTDYQISVLDDTNQPMKKKISIGRNALFEYEYRPMINIWIRQNTDVRPNEIIEKIKTLIDTIITDNEYTNVDNIHSIRCDLPQEFLEREFTTTEDEEIAMESIWHTKIQTYVLVHKWRVSP